MDAEILLRKKRQIKNELLEQRGLVEKKIAILGGSTTNEVADQLEIALLSAGIKPTIYQSAYNQYFQEAVLDNPELDAFAPDIIFIYTTARNITSADAGYLEELKGQLKQVWKNLKNKYHCPIIQNNFERFLYQYCGNQSIVNGEAAFPDKVNSFIYEYAAASDNFYVNDIDFLAAKIGLDNWYDDTAWHLYRYATSLKAIPYIAKSVARIIKSLYGKNKKVLVLDLDDTLWGGVIAEDPSIKLGSDAEGEAFLELHSYIKKLKERGVLLGICSKNEMRNAEKGLSHPEGILRKEDFVSIKANWDDKDQNIKVISDELNLPLSSFVFADDSAAMCELVKQSLPEVSVVQATSPKDLILAIEEAGFFEETVTTAEDSKRTEMYQANMKRQELEAHSLDYNDYLKSLEMVGRVIPFTSDYYDRITQLINKTNQFNLTVLRLSEADVKARAEADNYLTLAGWLDDKFGQNGLVSAIIAERKENFLEIELWIMSCRIFKRGFEFLMLSELVNRAKELGITEICGKYVPTEKNVIVKDLYKSFGFTCNGDRWVAKVDQICVPDNFIKLEK